jgi:hypothetical protein
MNNDVDATLRTLFAKAPYCASDEQFVAAVSNRIARHRKFRIATRAGAAVVTLGLTVVIAPSLVAATTYIAEAPILVIEPLHQFLASSFGWIAWVLVGVVLLAQATVRVGDFQS